MNIANGSTVTLEYSLYGDTDELIDSNVDAEPLTYTHGSGQLINGLEAALEGMEAGDRKRVSVPPEEGYGLFNPEALIEVPRDHLPEEAQQEGVAIQAQNSEGQTIDGVVTRLEEDTAVVDFNHPLAGQTLHFDISVLEVK